MRTGIDHCNELCRLLRIVCVVVVLVQHSNSTEKDLAARCWNAGQVELYHNDDLLFHSRFAATFNLPRGNVYIGPTSFLAFGCCTGNTSSSVSSNISTYGMLVSSYVLVTDVDWKCIHSNNWINNFYKSGLNDSLWSDAYVIESNDANDHPDFLLPFDQHSEPYAKWIWARMETGDIPSIYQNSIHPNCAFCRTRRIIKSELQPVIRTMVLFKSSLDLKSRPQRIYGMGIDTFNFTFELYAKSASNFGIGSCVREGKTVFIPCENVSNGPQIIVHFGVNLTDTSELRLCALNGENMTESCEVLAKAATNPLRCRQYESFWTQISQTNTVEVGAGRWFGRNRLLSANIGASICSHITHIQLQHDEPENPVYLRVHRSATRNKEKYMGENECLVLPHELDSLRICGNGSITNPEDCWRCHCCTLWNNTDSDRASSFTCFIPMNSILSNRNTAAAAMDLDFDDRTFCSPNFSSIIGQFKFYADRDVFSNNSMMTFFIWIQHVVKNMKIKLNFGDGHILSKISLNKSNLGEEYYYAAVAHRYVCPLGQVLEPTLELRGPNPQADVLRSSLTILFMEDDCADFCSSNGSQLNVHFAVFIQENKSHLNISMDFGDGVVDSNLTMKSEISDLPEWVKSCVLPNHSVAVIQHAYQHIGHFQPRVSVEICSRLRCGSSKYIVVGTFEDFSNSVGIINIFPSPHNFSPVLVRKTQMNFILYVEKFDSNLMVSVDYGDGTNSLDVPLDSNMMKENWTELFRIPGQYMSSVNHYYVFHELAKYTASIVVEHRDLPSWRLQKSCTITADDFGTVNSDADVFTSLESVTEVVAFNDSDAVLSTSKISAVEGLNVGSVVHSDFSTAVSESGLYETDGSDAVFVLRNLSKTATFAADVTEMRISKDDFTVDLFGREKKETTASTLSVNTPELTGPSAVNNTDLIEKQHVNEMFILKSVFKSIYPLDQAVFFMITDQNISAEINFGDQTPSVQMECRIVSDVAWINGTSELEVQAGLVMVASHQYTSPGLYVVKTDVAGHNGSKPFSAAMRISVLKYNGFILQNANETHLENSEVTFVILLKERPGKRNLLIDFSDQTAFQKIVLKKTDKIVLPEWVKIKSRAKKYPQFVAFIHHNYTTPGNYLVRLLLRDKDLKSIIAEDHLQMFSIEETLNALSISFHSGQNFTGALLIQSKRPIDDMHVEWIFGNTTLSKKITVEDWTSVAMEENISAIHLNVDQLPKLCSLPLNCHIALMQHTFEGHLPKLARVNIHLTAGGKTASRTESLIMNNSRRKFRLVVDGANNSLHEPVSVRRDHELLLHVLFHSEADHDDLISTGYVIKDDKGKGFGEEDLFLYNELIIDNRLEKSLVLKIPANTLNADIYLVTVEGTFLDRYGVQETTNATSRIIVFNSPIIASLQTAKLLYTVDEILVLDAGGSYDPNSNSSQGLEYFWTCFKDQSIKTDQLSQRHNDFGNCIENDKTLPNLDHLFKIPVSHLNLTDFPSTFHFQVLVSKVTVPSSSASVEITVSSGSAPSIQIVCLKHCEPYITVESILSFNCSNCGENEKLKAHWNFENHNNKSLDTFQLGNYTEVFYVKEFELQSLPTNIGIVNLTVTRADRTFGSVSFVVATDSSNSKASHESSKTSSKDSTNNSLVYLVLLSLIVPVLAFGLWLKERKSRRVAPRRGTAYQTTATEIELKPEVVELVQ